MHREAVWKLLKLYGLPHKFINIIQALYRNYNVRVIQNGQQSEKVAVDTGVRQGCILSPTIFLVVVDWVMRKATQQRRGITWKVFNSLEDLDFADDLCLISHKTEHLQAKTDDMVREGKKIGLSVNVNKTKTMSVNARPAKIEINNEKVENVNRFTYLGSVITTDGGAEADVRARIAKASYTFNTLSKVWKTGSISRHTKIRIFNSNVKSVYFMVQKLGCQTKQSLTNFKFL